MTGDPTLRSLAAAAGIAVEWTDNKGATQQPTPETLRHILAALHIPCATTADVSEGFEQIRKRAAPVTLPGLITAWAGEETPLPAALPERTRYHVEFEHGIHSDGLLGANSDGKPVLPAIERPGYHRLEIAGQSAILAVAPRRCWTFADAAPGERSWGIAAQTYGLYSNGAATEAFSRLGIGTFGDAGVLAEEAGRAGADALMISPAHALFHGDPSHYSPYSPSSRFHYNALQADPLAVFSANRLRGVFAAIAGPPITPDNQTAPLIDWPLASAGKRRLLEALYRSFSTYECSDPDNALTGDFLQFKRDGGLLLRQHALFEALHGDQFGRDFTRWHWRDWTGDFSHPKSRDVQAFARDHATAVDYHMFLQWLARRSLEKAQQRALDSGMRVGLINDLAVGLNSGGSHAWSMQDDLLHGLAIGAPPDALAPRGQNWGLTTFSPLALRDNAYATFLATLRASLEPAGGLRIDHAMGLKRLWLIPDGGTSADGAYLSYPLDDMLRLIALESQRMKKVIIGEDLGTVPAGFRQTLGEAGLAGMRVLLFEHNGDGLRPPAHYPAETIAMTTTHDTPTLIGWQRGLDISLREDLAQLPPDAVADLARRERAQEREDMRRAFSLAGLSPGSPDYLAQAMEERCFAAAAISYAAMTRSQFCAIPLEDISGQVEQPNLPGTSTEYPNWRRRYRAPVQSILKTNPAASHVAALRRTRPRKDRDSGSGDQ
ncbi:MAG: 4-alpha-glucanotransferase [Hyphomicrobiales bacterium]|nr:4-alpha-glucanotransferase [Hyphomicrobiales bacterium]